MTLAQRQKSVSAVLADGTEALVVAGDQALHVEGNLQASRQWFDVAYREAERVGNRRVLALAALGLGGLWVHEHRSLTTAALVQARQQHALRLVDRDSSLALRLRARLAAEADYRTGRHAAVMAIVEETGRAGDPIARAEALSLAHHCVLGPDHGALRLKLAQELIAESSRTERRSDLLMGLLWQTIDLFLGDDPHAQRRLRELHGLLAHADHLAVGYIARSIEVMLSIRAGRFEQAEAQAAACAGYGSAAGDLDSTGWYGGQLVAIRWYQGRIAELVPMLREMVHSPALSAVDNSFFAAHAVAAATAGDLQQAAGALARLQVRDLAELPRSSSWLVAMYGIVEAAHLLADADTAAQAYAVLDPFARLPMMASLGVACFGSVHHALGVASLTMGNAAEAVGHLRAAVRHNLALGHWPAVALSRYRLGEALTLRSGPQDTAEAATEIATAAQEAAQLGMALPNGTRPHEAASGGTWPHEALAVDVDRADGDRTDGDRVDLSLRSGGSASVGDGPHLVVCHRRGRQWRIEMGHRMALVEHSVGMSHLAILLANPKHEVRAIDLASSAGLPGMASADAQVTSIQPILDDVAKREYRERLSQLDAEIDELDALNDLERAAQLRADRDWLVTELAAATGVHGRSRTFTGGEERARVAVGKAIRRALNRIAEADSAIGEELRATVQTGLRCCYRPE